MKDLTPALFISEQGARDAATKLALIKGIKLQGVYAQRRSVRDMVGWTATYTSEKLGYNSKYVTNDDVERLL